MALTKDQNKALSKLLEFVENDTDIAMTLNGYAGTGKTFLTKQFILDCKFRGVRRISCSAPTHKAKNIMAKSSGLPAITIQKLLGVQPILNVYNYNPDKPTFKQIADPSIRFYDLVIIDECSMLDEFYYNLVIKEARIHKCKVLFIGDAFQLPPVNPSKSGKISPTFTNNKRVDLKEIVRQDIDNPLLILLNSIRQSIQNKSNGYLKLLAEGDKISNGVGYRIVRNKKEFLSLLNTYFKSNAFEEDQNFVRFLAYRNSTINNVNKLLAKKDKRGDELYIEENDLLMAYKTVSTYNGVSNVDKITNSSEYKVTEVSTFTNMYGIKVTRCFLEDINNQTLTSIELVNPSSYEKYIEERNIRTKRAMENRHKTDFQRLNNFIDNNTLYQDIDNTFEDYYHKKAKKFYKGIDFGYGITVHKSQGSTYNTVFIDGRDINLNKNFFERLRLWYVACSRASDRVFIHI